MSGRTFLIRAVSDLAVACRACPGGVDVNPLILNVAHSRLISDPPCGVSGVIG